MRFAAGWRRSCSRRGRGRGCGRRAPRCCTSCWGGRWCAYPVELARELGADPVVAVLGHQRAAVEAALVARFGADAVTVVEQTEQRGTGHAVKLAMAALKGFTGDLVLVLYGDVPLLRRETLAALVGAARRVSAAWRW